MEDKEIVILCKDGQARKAFSEIVRKYSERLYWHVRSFGCSHEDSNDLLQEIFIKVWNALPSFRGEAQLFTWLWRIATNETLNYLKKSKLRAALSFKRIEPSDDRKADEDAWLDGNKLQILLFKAIKRLPTKQRAVFTMRYYQELSYEQISEILGTSIGALKASYHFAYEKIKAELEKEV